MKVAVVGMRDEDLGFWQGLENGHELDIITFGRERINACEIAFVYVPQPEVDDVMQWLRVPLIAIRTTMPEFYRDHEYTTFAASPNIHVVYQPICDARVGLVVAGGTKAREVCDFWRPMMAEHTCYVATSWRIAERIRATIEQYRGGILTALERKLLELMGDGVRTVVDYSRGVSLAN